MYSPFLFVFVSRGRLVCWLNSTIFAPSTGLPCVSTTLPFTCPVWADAGAANIARASVMAHSMSVRRTEALDMGNPPLKEIAGTDEPAGIFYTQRRATFVIRYSRTGPRLAARELIARLAATVVARRPADRAPPWLAYSRRICGAAELLRSTDAPRDASAMTLR